VNILKPLEFRLVDGYVDLAIATGHEGNRISTDQLGPIVEMLRSLQGYEAEGVFLRSSATDFCRGRKDYPPVVSREVAGEIVNSNVELIRAFQDLPGPKISYISGYASGLGATLALAADFVVMGKGSQITFPETAAGFTPLLALNSLVQRISSLEALWFIFSGQPISALRAKEIGLVSDVLSEPVARKIFTHLLRNREFLQVGTHFLQERARKEGRLQFAVNSMIEELWLRNNQDNGGRAE